MTEAKTFKLAVLKNESQDFELWTNSLDELGIQNYEVIDITLDSWLENIHHSKPNYLLTKPPGLTSIYKQLYDERVYILKYVLGYKLFPTFEEILIYENKRFLSYWLKANDLPHPRTSIYYQLEEARKNIDHIGFPVVSKTNIGASGSGVKIIESKEVLGEYLEKTFQGTGQKRRWGPDLEKSGLFKRGIYYIFHPKDISKKLNLYRVRKTEIQKGFVILQEYIPHEFEWRAVRIGDSFFAHKKLKMGDKSSGSLIKSYENPPLRLLDFIKEITDKHGFYSQAIDIFEKKDGSFLINEMQCMFGQSDPYQMLVDERAGRYRYLDGQWSFEPGDFAANQCFDLRVRYILSQLGNPQD